jgi:hypothetical protein
MTSKEVFLFPQETCGKSETLDPWGVIKRFVIRADA